MIYHYDIINAIKDYINKKETSDGSRTLFEDSLANISDLHEKLLSHPYLIYDPNLPIDLISYKPYTDTSDEDTTKQYYQYTLFIVISLESIPQELYNKVLFYKTYLSQIISSKDLKFVLVIEHNTKISESDNNDGIGVWTYDRGLTITESVRPWSLREIIDRDYVTNKPEDISRFCDKYIHDTVNAIVGIDPKEIGKSYLDKKILGEIFKIQHIPYKDKLLELLNKHLTEKGSEQIFANELFEDLWNNNLTINYKQTLDKFEAGLQYIFSGYRDHYIHQLQVFLLGLPIIDKLYDKFSERYENPALSWLVASSFHDVAYPVQQYDKFGDRFFSQVFRIQRNPAYCEFRQRFIDDNFLSCMGYIVCNVCSKLFHRELQSNWLDSENTLIKRFYNLITTDKNHGVMSSVSLLMLSQDDSSEERKAIYDKIIIPASLSIAIHDSHVWPGIFSNNEKVIKNIAFSDDPLSFLLIFCDTIQEWARPSGSDPDSEQKKEFYLKEFIVENNKIDVTLWTPRTKKSEDFFGNKQREIRTVQRLLKQPEDVKFSIALKDCNDRGEDFEMSGV